MAPKAERVVRLPGHSRRAEEGTGEDRRGIDAARAVVEKKNRERLASLDAEWELAFAEREFRIPPYMDAVMS